VGQSKHPLHEHQNITGKQRNSQKVFYEKQKEIVRYKIEGYRELLETFKAMPYKEYLLTEHWQHFKKEALNFFGHKCQLCNSKNMELCVHHKTYKNKGRETNSKFYKKGDGEDE